MTDTTVLQNTTNVNLWKLIDFQQVIQMYDQATLCIGSLTSIYVVSTSCPMVNRFVINFDDFLHHL